MGDWLVPKQVPFGTSDLMRKEAQIEKLTYFDRETRFVVLNAFLFRWNFLLEARSRTPK